MLHPHLSPIEQRSLLGTLSNNLPVGSPLICTDYTDFLSASPLLLEGAYSVFPRRPVDDNLGDNSAFGTILDIIYPIPSDYEEFFKSYIDSQPKSRFNKPVKHVSNFAKPIKKSTFISTTIDIPF